MAWGFDGEQLNIRWALAVCHIAGFRGSKLTQAVALMTAESNRYTKAWHENIITRDGRDIVDSVDRGLFQINSKWHPDLKWPDYWNPIKNAKYAYKISGEGRHWTAWMASTSPRYFAAIPIVAAVKALGTWKSRIDNVKRRWGNE
jgi:hypothetical protein